MDAVQDKKNADGQSKDEFAEIVECGIGQGLRSMRLVCEPIIKVLEAYKST
jgi:hypothetical protein